MSSTPFRQDALFQLNLLIWLSWPARAGVYPLFHDHGFALYRLSQEIAVPVAARLAAGSAAPPIPMGRAASADLLLRHEARRQFIALECKVSSFGPVSSTAGQATAMLVCAGPHLAATLGITPPAPWRVVPTYAVTYDQQEAMALTLDALAGDLTRAGVATCPDPATAFGIEVADDGVYLHFAAPARLPFPTPTSVKVLEREPGEDPRPLYVIPLDPGVNLSDSYGRRMLESLVRRAFLGLLGRELGRGALTVDWDALMTAAIAVWPLWRDRGKANLRQQCKTYVRRRMRPLERLGVTFAETPSGFVIGDVDQATAEKVLRDLATPAPRQERVRLEEGGQMTIDDLPEEDDA